jgi:hypothetical protein
MTNAELALARAIEADENLPFLRARLDQVDGSEAHRMLSEIWPSIRAILALSDLATERNAPAPSAGEEK